MRAGVSSSGGSGSGATHGGGWLRCSSTMREQPPVDLREESDIIAAECHNQKEEKRREVEASIRKKESEDILLAKRLSMEEEAKREKRQKSGKMIKFLKSLGAFYGKIGIKYKSCHKKCLNDLAKIIREQDEEFSPTSNLEEANFYADNGSDDDNDSDGDGGYNIYSGHHPPRYSSYY